MEVINIRVEEVECSIAYRKDSKSDLAVIAEIFSHKQYSLFNFKHAPKVVDYYHDILNRSDTPLIVDLGANIGASALWFSAIYEHSKIIVIEPEVGNLELLNLNVRKINAQVFNGAISSEPGELFVHDPGSGDWGFRISSERTDRKVRAYTMNELLADHVKPLEIPFICKIDIEGAEKDLFSRNTEWVKKFPLIMIEIHDWMIPGQAISKHLFNIIGNGNFDVLVRGQSLFFFNNDLLYEGL